MFKKYVQINKYLAKKALKIQHCEVEQFRSSVAEMAVNVPVTATKYFRTSTLCSHVYRLSTGRTAGEKSVLNQSRYIKGLTKALGLIQTVPVMSLMYPVHVSLPLPGTRWPRVYPKAWKHRRLWESSSPRRPHSPFTRQAQARESKPVLMVHANARINSSLARGSVRVSKAWRISDKYWGHIYNWEHTCVGSHKHWDQIRDMLVWWYQQCW